MVIGFYLALGSRMCMRVRACMHVCMLACQCVSVCVCGGGGGGGGGLVECT